MLSMIYKTDLKRLLSSVRQGYVIHIAFLYANQKHLTLLTLRRIKQSSFATKQAIHV